MGEEPGIAVSAPIRSTLDEIMDLEEWLKSHWSKDDLTETRDMLTLKWPKSPI